MKQIAAALPLLAVLLSLPLGCRENSVPPGTPVAVPLSMHFHAGDVLTYSAWPIDISGNLILSEHARVILHVLSAGDTLPEMQNVVLMADSTRADSAAGWAVDTLRFAFSPEGDVYQFGFVADVLRRLESRTVTPRWDRIGAFSLGRGVAWTLGTEDSLFGNLFSGVIDDQQDYFTVDVRGRQMIVAAYQVTITAGDYQRSYWITDTPPSFTRTLELATDTIPGVLQDLVAIGTAGP